MPNRFGLILLGLFAFVSATMAQPHATVAQQDSQTQGSPDSSSAQTAETAADTGASTDQPATAPTSASSSADLTPVTGITRQLRAAGDQADAWKAQLDNMLLALEREGVREERLTEMREIADGIIEQAHTIEGRIQPELNAIQARLNQLGPAPGEGDPPESQDLADRRAAETAALSAADSTLKRIRLAIVQAQQVVREITSVRRARFARALFVQNRSVLNPSLWIDGFQAVPQVTRGFGYLIDDSIAVMKSRLTANKLLILAGSVVMALIIGVFIRRTMRRFAPPIGESQEEVSRLRKLLRALLVMLTDGVLPVVAVAVIYGALELTELRTPRLIELNKGLFAAIAIFSFMFGLARGVFAPLRPGWRLVRITDAAATQVVASVTLLGAILAISAYLEVANDVLIAPVSMEVTKRALTTLLIALVVGSSLYRVASSYNDSETAQSSDPSVVWSWLRSVVWIVLLTAVVALVLGYIAFGNFLALQLVLAGAIFLVVWLILGLIEELTNLLLKPGNALIARFSATSGIGESGITQLTLIASGALRLALMALGAILLLMPWGLDTGQWRQWMQKAFFGFQIGGVSISLSSILGGVIFFVVGLVITRGIQSWLGNRFLPNTNLDVGLRNSIRTIVGYAGVIVAAILAFTYMGFNLENIALLAGALSVGIGFGLQSIVNNFVSGLILLAERPIKEGDWIVVGAEQGYVRKISIRSTEIETFDRSSVIIPNSDLITGTVNNWMHSNRMGRVALSVGVGYGSDPEQVRDILLDVARQHADVLAYPEPRVYFMDFGDSSLVFNLYAYLADINSSLSVRSDFRFEILKKFREESIEIPFPQRDINLRDIDRLESIAAENTRTSGKTEP